MRVIFFVIFVAMKVFLHAISAFLLFFGAAAGAQEYGIVNISVCNLRENPSYSAEMVSQALLGTPVQILERGGDYLWPKVQTPDGYTGWVHKDAIATVSRDQIHSWNHSPQIVVTDVTAIVYEQPSTGSQVVSDAVAGCRLVLVGSKGLWYRVRFPDGRQGYVKKSQSKELSSWRKGLDNSAGGIIATALGMNGFPYLWAGMSVKGMDCSGFVRQVFFMHDYILPRDSGPQSALGERIYGTEGLEPCDLVFFGRMDGDTPRVSHVGIYIGNGRFIHSLGLVKIGSFLADDPLYDSYNAGRYLFGTRILPCLDTDSRISTTLDNPSYLW